MRPEQPSNTRNLIPCPDCGHLCSTAARICPNCGRPAAEVASDAAPLRGDRIYEHVLSHSFVMVGLCLTLLGLVKLVEGLKHLSSLADELLAANAVIFLISGLLSHFALKSLPGQRKQVMGRIGDVTFSFGIVCLAAICCVIALSLV